MIVDVINALIASDYNSSGLPYLFLIKNTLFVVLLDGCVIDLLKGVSTQPINTSKYNSKYFKEFGNNLTGKLTFY